MDSGACGKELQSVIVMFAADVGARGSLESCDVDGACRGDRALDVCVVGD